MFCMNIGNDDTGDDGDVDVDGDSNNEVDKDWW